MLPSSWDHTAVITNFISVILRGEKRCTDKVSSQFFGISEQLFIHFKPRILFLCPVSCDFNSFSLFKLHWKVVNKCDFVFLTPVFFFFTFCSFKAPAGAPMLRCRVSPGQALAGRAAARRRCDGGHSRPAGGVAFPASCTFYSTGVSKASFSQQLSS